MKKFLIGLAVVIFFLFLVAVILLKVIGSTSEKPVVTDHDVSFTVTSSLQKIDTATPENTAYACYTWYLQYSSTQIVSTQVISTNSTIAHCFTSDFIHKWSASLAYPDYFDPVLRAADFGDSWLTSKVEAIQSSGTANTSFVNVIIGKGGTEAQTVTVHLIKVNSDWKIDSVENPG